MSLEVQIAQLRARAEKVLQSQGDGKESVTPAGGEEMMDVLRLLEELRVYQTELEIQNQDLRAAQLESERSLNKYRRLFEHMPIPGVIVDQKGFVIEGNTCARQQFGLHQRVELQHRSLYQLFELDSRSTVHALLAKQDPHCTATNCTIARKDSKQVQTVDVHTLRLPWQEEEDSVRLVLFVDRTAEWMLKAKQSVLLDIETELRLERHRLRGILDGTRAGTWEWGVLDSSLVVNERWMEILGYTSGELQHAAMEDRSALIHPDDLEKSQRLLDEHLSGHRSFYECELRFRHKEGNWIWAVERARVIDRDPKSAPTHVAGTLIDVTESVLLREETASSYALLANLARQIPGVIFQYQRLATGETRFPYASEGIQTMFEVLPADVLADDAAVFEKVFPTDRGALVESIRRSASQLEPWSYEFRVLLPKQGLRWRSGTAQPVRQADGSTLWHGFITDITEHKLVEEKLFEFNRDFEAFLDQTTDFVYFKDRESRMRFCSQTLAKLCGYNDWRLMLGKHDRELFPPSTASIYEAEEIPVLRDAKPLLNKVDPFIRTDGSTGFVQTNKWPLIDANGEVAGIFGISRDVTETLEAQNRIRLAASVFTNAREAIMITDSQVNIVEVNESFTRITGFSREEVMGKNPRVLSSGRQSSDYYKEMWRLIQSEGFWSGEIWNRRRDGEVYAELKTISAIRDEAGQLQYYVGLGSDITLIKTHQDELEHVAHYDSLTGLPNRLLFSDRLRQAMLQCDRRQKHLCVAFIDLDGFKAVNDSHGHLAGDELLKTVADRMKFALREVDSLARIGGDEFVAILDDLDDGADCLCILERLLLAASEPVTMMLENSTVTLKVSASIGATIYPNDAADADLLIRHADQAMYLAKQSGKNRFHLFDVDHDAAVQSRRDILEQIGRALTLNQFELYYQPKVNLASGTVVGFEALLRWNHPDQSVWCPGQFLPDIENHPISSNIGEWVASTAIAQLAQWTEMGLDLEVSINIGAVQLQQPDFPLRLEKLLSAYSQTVRSRLTLEILESAALADIDATARKLHSCSSLGVRFALDDFGTGYSSLVYLKHLPAKTLKIDQSFVRDMLVDPEDRSIVSAIIGLAKNFGREVIAEGVESAAQADQLLAMGCFMVQGFGVAKPMRATEVVEWLGRWRANPSVMDYSQHHLG